MDNVQVEGRDDVRLARRQAIASITRCINLLESKLLDSIERSNEGETGTAAAASTAQQDDEPMDVQCKIDEEPCDVPAAADANPPPTPTKHVTQMVINITQPTCVQVVQPNNADAQEKANE